MADAAGAVGGVLRSLRGMARADVIVDSLDQRCEACSPVSRRSSGPQVACPAALACARFSVFSGLCSCVGVESG
ncbi:hypothetical protein BN2476_540012 [Paraburkholderia piptadeniae]|uniref:Uncharacterized protein n=1 Tax=Paraburkholderia piptadeniae TaxID=1701573 RepID=A0A1N7SHV4_9BURK|nr:hypothetical protein BN2476_540012 [Paraburkholderia piptadeniae]